MGIITRVEAALFNSNINHQNNQEEKQMKKEESKIIKFDDLLQEAIKDLDRDSSVSLTSVDKTDEFIAKVTEIEANKEE